MRGDTATKRPKSRIYGFHGGNVNREYAEVFQAYRVVA